MILDDLSLAVLLCLSFLIQALILGIQARSCRSDASLRSWALGSLCLGLGPAIAHLGLVPSLAGLVAAGRGLFLVSGMAFLLGGTRLFLGLPVRLPRLLILGMALFALSLLAGQPGLSLALASLSLLLSLSLFLKPSRRAHAAQLFLAVIFLGHGLFWAAQAVYSLPGGAPMAAAYLEGIVASTLWTFGFSLLVFQDLRSRIEVDVEDRRLVFDTNPDAVAVNRLSDGCYVDINEGFTALTGLAREEILGLKNWELGFCRRTEDRLRLLSILAEKGSCEGFETTIVRKDGSVIEGQVSARIVSLHGQSHVVSITRDITDRKAAEARVQDLVRQLEVEKDYAERRAMTDGLTCLLNRKSFDEALMTEFMRHRRSGLPLAVIMMDIDHFKDFNDRFGHVAGDECLRRVAAALQSCVERSPDTLARYGGEEFVVLLPNTEQWGAATVAERLRRAVEALHIAHSPSASLPWVSISIGVSCACPSRLSSPEDAVALADAALYEAKKAGRNQVAMAQEPRAGTGLPSSMDEMSVVQLVWKLDYACGNAAIDAQHEGLFAASNRLLSAFVEKRPEEECAALLSGILGDIARHFRDEEGILSDAGFPDAEGHAALHAALMAKARALAAEFEAGTLSFNELFGFLVMDVVSLHMFMEDRKFFPYIVPRA